MISERQKEKYRALLEMYRDDMDRFRGKSEEEIYNHICGHFCMVDFRVARDVSRIILSRLEEEDRR